MNTHFIDGNCTTISWNMMNVAIPWVTVRCENNQKTLETTQIKI